MKITIEPTPVLTQINGAPARLWQGVTDAGTRCQVYVAAVAVEEDDAGANLAFGGALKAVVPPPEAYVPAWMLTPARPAGEG